MVMVRRAGSGSKSEDKEALEWLEEIAAKGDMTDEEVQELISEMSDRNDDLDAEESWEVIRERFKRERALDNFESGGGSFRRSK